MTTQELTPKSRVLELVDHYGYWWKTAEVLCIGQHCLNDIVSGRTKEPTTKILTALGIEKVVTYRLIDPNRVIQIEAPEPVQHQGKGREALEAAKQRARISCTDIT